MPDPYHAPLVSAAVTKNVVERRFDTRLGMFVAALKNGCQEIDSGSPRERNPRLLGPSEADFDIDDIRTVVLPFHCVRVGIRLIEAGGRAFVRSSDGERTLRDELQLSGPHQLSEALADGVATFSQGRLTVTSIFGTSPQMLVEKLTEALPKVPIDVIADQSSLDAVLLSRDVLLSFRARPPVAEKAFGPPQNVRDQR